MESLCDHRRVVLDVGLGVAERKSRVGIREHLHFHGRVVAGGAFFIPTAIGGASERVGVSGVRIVESVTCRYSGQQEIDEIFSCPLLVLRCDGVFHRSVAEVLTASACWGNGSSLSDFKLGADGVEPCVGAYGKVNSPVGIHHRLGGVGDIEECVLPFVFFDMHPCLCDVTFGIGGFVLETG